MDHRELTKRIEKLSKAIASNEPTDTIIDLLELLKNDAAPTEEQLRSTKAGVTIGKLRSHSDKAIGRAAMEIVHKWRKKVDAAKDAKKKKLDMRNSPAPVGSPAPAPSSYSKPYQGDSTKRHFKVDKVDLARTGSQSRDNSVGLLYNGLAFRSTASIEEVVARAVEVENEAFKKFNGENDKYRAKLRSLFTSLKRKDNRELGRRVLSGDIPASKFVVMSDQELSSEEQRKKDQEFEKENMMKAQVPMAERSISDALQCGKCGQKKVSYTQAQTRSADEPMTTFCECMSCGNRWKFS
ncbi:transcription factor S-II, central domain-containing protein [Lasiosphaeria miniovina]|uniref:Transcription elongation factor n=1 Tax=Lasiosphaeria miniovina TaxID=1954250 RepID=A0AA40BFZ4_9PEZI|nr:transcription factor S-II, central domain-containing protein [Lasiosphaeria miniovina]KAK0733525.1 transcription factor S-II, central domain-containing protein [Lasiosphaeria miniovina]